MKDIKLRLQHFKAHISNQCQILLILKFARVTAVLARQKLMQHTTKQERIENSLSREVFQSWKLLKDNHTAKLSRTLKADHRKKQFAKPTTLKVVLEHLHNV